MTLDKRHMGISLALLVAAAMYNLWVFTASGPRIAAPQPGGPVQALPGQPTPNNGGPIDPAQVKALTDVALDRVPEWPRNPFENMRPKAAEVIEVVEDTPAPAPPPEPDPVVGTILYSPDRRAAVIDGHVVRIGDMVGTSRIVDILPRAVIVDSSDRGRRTLALKAATGTAGRK